MRGISDGQFRGLSLWAGSCNSACDSGLISDVKMAEASATDKEKKLLACLDKMQVRSPALTLLLPDIICKTLVFPKVFARGFRWLGSRLPQVKALEETVHIPISFMF